MGSKFVNKIGGGGYEGNIKKAFKAHGMAKRKAIQNKLKGIKGFGEGDPKKD